MYIIVFWMEKYPAGSYTQSIFRLKKSPSFKNLFLEYKYFLYTFCFIKFQYILYQSVFWLHNYLIYFQVFPEKLRLRCCVNVTQSVCFTCLSLKMFLIFMKCYYCLLNNCFALLWLSNVDLLSNVMRCRALSETEWCCGVGWEMGDDVASGGFTCSDWVRLTSHILLLLINFCKWCIEDSNP